MDEWRPKRLAAGVTCKVGLPSRCQTASYVCLPSNGRVSAWCENATRYSFVRPSLGSQLGAYRPSVTLGLR